jgi:hypothetical protein
MLLSGDGDVSRGLVAGVQEAAARTGRGQLLVLYLPRIEVGAAAVMTAVSFAEQRVVVTDQSVVGVCIFMVVECWAARFVTQDLLAALINLQVSVAY